MRKLVWLSTILLICFISCKSKKKTEPENNYLSALAVIKGQVAHVDTSLYPIMRIVVVDSSHSDTVFIPREEFSAAAKDFLTIPDLGDKEVAKRFNEEKLFDQTIGRYVITYTPIDPAKEELQKQEFYVDPSADEKNNITNIFISRSMSNRDSSVTKNMLWQLNKYFQVTTIKQLPGKPETVSTVRISWNEEKFD
jgi:hypothetical protein